jgi:hypothetical protein
MVISNPYILGLLIAAVVIAIVHLAERHLIRRPFWRKVVMYPADHAVAGERVLKYVDVVAADPALSDDQIVVELVRQEVPALDAELIVRFVPMAFAWTVLRKMGVSSFPSSFVVFDRNERPVEMPLAREHYFASALVVADGVVGGGFSDRVTRTTFEAIFTRSAEMDAANQMLAAGKQLAGSKIMPPALLGLPAEQIRDARRRAGEQM